MVLIVVIVNLLHYYSGFLRTEASQVWVGMQFGIKLLVQESPRSMYLVVRCRNF